MHDPASDLLLFIVCSPSGAGKTTLTRDLLQRFAGLTFSVSCTTRKARSGEVDGKDYFYITRDEFLKRTSQGAFLEWAEVHGNLYGTSLGELERARGEGKVGIVFDVDYQGARQIKAKLPSAVGIFILPPSMEELGRRLRGRGTDDEATIQRRFAKAKVEIENYRLFDYLIVNDDLDKSHLRLRSIVYAEATRRGGRGWRCRPSDSCVRRTSARGRSSRSDRGRAAAHCALARARHASDPARPRRRKHAPRSYRRCARHLAQHHPRPLASSHARVGRREQRPRQLPLSSTIRDARSVPTPTSRASTRGRARAICSTCLCARGESSASARRFSPPGQRRDRQLRAGRGRSPLACGPARPSACGGRPRRRGRGGQHDGGAAWAVRRRSHRAARHTTGHGAAHRSWRASRDRRRRASGARAGAPAGGDRQEVLAQCFIDFGRPIARACVVDPPPSAPPSATSTACRRGRADFTFRANAAGWAVP